MARLLATLTTVVSLILNIPTQNTQTHGNFFVNRDDYPALCLSPSLNINAIENLAKKHWISPALSIRIPADFSYIDRKDFNTAASLVSLIKTAESFGEKFNLEEQDAYIKLIFTGKTIFTAYSSYLNSHGREIKHRFDTLCSEFSEQTFDWKTANIRQLKEMLSFIPTVANPQDDLMNDILSHFTDEELKSFVNITHRTLYMEITSLCPNRCAFCNHGERKGKLYSLPFPVLIKLLKRLKPHVTTLIPYVHTDPFHYHDPSINATLVDVVNWSQKIGIKNFSIITHGGAGRLRELSAYVAAKLPIAFAVSVHLFHDDALRYANTRIRGEGTLQGQEAARERLIQKYVARFQPLIAAGSRNKEGVEVRTYSQRFTEVTPEIWEKHPDTIRVLSELIEINKELNTRITRSLTATHAPRIRFRPAKGFYLNGRFAGYLTKQFGLSRDEINQISTGIKKLLNAHWSETDIYSQLNVLTAITADGRLEMLTLEREFQLYRKVNELFNDPQDVGFQTLVGILKLLSSPNAVRNGHLSHATSISSRLQSSPEILLTFNLFRNNRYYLPDLGDTVEFTFDFDLLDFIHRFYISSQQLTSLPLYLWETDLTPIYNSLRELPIPLEWHIALLKGNPQRYHGSKNFLLSGEKNPIFSPNLFAAVTRFPLPVHASRKLLSQSAAYNENRRIITPQNTPLKESWECLLSAI